MNEVEAKATEWSLIRQSHRTSDIVFFSISLILGALFGYLIAIRINWAVGLPFAMFCIAIMYFMWRSPEAPTKVA
ncbi:hypothetical protein I1A_002563 [Pseudomonas fluorescens R124]|uniref:Uncharacterized protein n=1 Tax=Pseudomonas fluorescens R124 TaxID=743713 RepID=A0A7U9CTD6_PSEFL|nr:hypothetical protein I1A_002563 [Pseudomonas fluorescens R124]